MHFSLSHIIQKGVSLYGCSKNNPYFYFTSASPCKLDYFLKKATLIRLLYSLRTWNLPHVSQIPLKNHPFLQPSCNRFLSLEEEGGRGSLTVNPIAFGHVTRSSPIKTCTGCRPAVTFLHGQGVKLCF